MVAILRSQRFEIFITTIILLNALTLGLETSSEVMTRFGGVIRHLDKFFLAIFVIELLMKLIVFRMKFLRDPWGIFDIVVVGIALVPATGAMSALRALRVLRTLRLITVIPSLKRVVEGLLAAIPGLGAVVVIMTLVFYVGAVVSTKLFGSAFPEWFGNIGASSYSLFQIMTLESWSMGIVRPVMEKFPLAWLFFIPFILATTFVMLNLFVAVIVNSMQAETENEAQKRSEKGANERALLLEELTALRNQLRGPHSLGKGPDPLRPKGEERMPGLGENEPEILIDH
jgi:voltage-gated sodium channel